MNVKPALVLLAVIAAASPAAAQRTSNRAINDLNILVGANLGEATTLRAELPALSKNRRAVRVWKHMIKDHKKGAEMIARADRAMGGRPNMTPPAAGPAKGSAKDIIKQTLQAHRDTLTTVKNMQSHARGRERRVLAAVRGVVEHHIMMIRALM